MLKPGLYEQVINHEIKAELDVIPENRSYTDKIDSAKASGILTSYISEVIKKGLDSISDGDSILPQIDLINKIIGMMAGETGEDYEELAVTEDARQLLALSLMNFIMRRLLHIRGFLTILSRRSCWGLLLHRNVWMVKMFWIILTDGLGFCVSVQHAKFMSEYFNSKGIPSISLEKDSSNELRRTAKKKLVSGEIKFIFVVDLYNEGVDIPEVDTILFLRPTESLTVFLQQLGRGLRLSEGKDCLTVLDFIGQSNKKYNFEEKFAALLSNTNHSVQQEIKRGFVSLPKGCYIQLEKKASNIILDNIRKSFGDKNGLLAKIKYFSEDSERPLTLSNFVSYYHIPLKVIYKKYSFARLCVEAEVREDFDEPLEDTITKSFGKIAAIDSRRWIRFLITNLRGLTIDKIKEMNPAEQRMIQIPVINP